LLCRLLDESEGVGVGVELEWSKPSNPHGELLGYRLRYGARQDDQQEGGQPLVYTEEDIVGPHTLQHRVQGLGEWINFITQLAPPPAAVALFTGLLRRPENGLMHNLRKVRLSRQCFPSLFWSE